MLDQHLDGRLDLQLARHQEAPEHRRVAEVHLGLQLARLQR
jgi:hypothetical protein